MKAWWQLHRVTLLCLTVLYLLTTLPFVSQLPFNWDAAQFNLALHHYSIGMHQPHPPGYPLFIVLGKFVSLVLSDNLALVAISAVFGLISVIMLYQFCYRLWSNQLVAALIAVSWLLNPLFWLYREVALTYTADAAASITIAYLVWQTITLRERKYLLMSSIVLTTAGAIRPSLLLLLLPLVIFQASFHRRNWRLLLVAVGVILLGTMAWLVPVCWLTGGVGAYLEYSRNLYSTAADSIKIWPQTQLVWNTVLSSLNLVALPMAVGLVILLQRTLRFWRRLWMIYLYVAVWLLPALGVYCLIHFGQVGYALCITIPLYLCLVPFGRWLQTLSRVWLRSALLWCCGLLLLAHAAIFLVLTPAYGHPNFFPTTRAALYLQHLARWTPNLFKWNRTIIHDSDIYLQGVQEIAQHYPAEETMIITSRDLLYPSPINGLMIRNDEIFREISYSLPNYPIYEVAPKRDYYLQSHQYQMGIIYDQTVVIPNTTRYVLFVIDVIPSGMQPVGLLTEAVTVPGTSHQLHVGVIDQPWTFGTVTVMRQADQIANPNVSR